jgi:hypothetical protein
MSGKRLNKTYLMQLLENRHPGYTIEALLLKAFREHGNEKDAANALGITQQTFSSWKYRLDLQDLLARLSPTIPSRIKGQCDDESK